jgi:8-oxo-dGTP pyrophosphatase MutT (NUDIX family)
VREQITARLASSAVPEDPVRDVEGALSERLLTTWFRLPLRPAAVLIPLVARPGGLHVVFTVRRHDMSDHPGQIAFPGGRPDLADTNLQATAMREAHEEIGLDPAAVRILGNLGAQGVISGFAVVPFVGLVGGDFEPIAQPSEVAEVFEVPLDFLLDEANGKRVDRTRSGVDLPTWEYQWEEHLIWGATGQMVRSFIKKIR